MKETNIPNEWRVAIVAPVFKGKGDKHKADNYRPLSLTCVVCKLWESILSDYIRHVREMTNWFDRRQFRFSKGYSTEAQLVGFQQDIADIFDSGSQTDCIAIDLFKAFGRVDHGRLLMKIRAIGLDKRVVDFVAIFLENRTKK